jgi:hypothetical protein
VCVRAKDDHYHSYSHKRSYSGKDNYEFLCSRRLRRHGHWNGNGYNYVFGSGELRATKRALIYVTLNVNLIMTTPEGHDGAFEGLETHGALRGVHLRV